MQPTFVTTLDWNLVKSKRGAPTIIARVQLLDGVADVGCELDFSDVKSHDGNVQRIGIAIH